MSNPYWLHTNDSERLPKTFVLQVMPNELVWASGTPKALTNVVNRLQTGGNADLKAPKRLPRSAVVAVDYEVGSDWVKVRDGAGQRHSVFTAASTTEAANVARDLAGHLGLPAQPSDSPASVGSITVGPAIGLAVFAVLTGLLYVASDPDGNDTQRYGRAGLVKRITESLGQTGVLLLGIGLMLACVGYWAYLYVNRPVVKSFGRPMTTA